MSKINSSKIALVTGGNSGIGKAIAEKLDKSGVKVIVADIAKAKEIRESIIFKRCDISKEKEIQELYEWMADNVGQPDILILGAGRGIQEKLTEGDPTKWQQIINTNLMGPLRCVRAFVPSMLKKEEGNIVFISSVSANQPHPYGGIYSASKTALEVIAETLRLETLPHINITVVSPGIVDTSFFENQLVGDNSVEEIGMGAMEAEEIADDVLYALNKKKGTSINKIVSRPTLQSF